jgi:hypothetical protein
MGGDACFVCRDGGAENVEIVAIIEETTEMTKMAKKLEPIFPGEILAEEFMAPHGLSQNRLARDIDVNPASMTSCMAARRSRRQSRCGSPSISVRRRSCG